MRTYVVIDRGQGKGIGYIKGELRQHYPGETKKAVHFPGETYPRDFRFVQMARLRLATPLEILAAGLD